METRLASPELGGNSEDLQRHYQKEATWLDDIQKVEAIKNSNNDIYKRACKLFSTIVLKITSRCWAVLKDFIILYEVWRFWAFVILALMLVFFLQPIFFTSELSLVVTSGFIVIGVLGLYYFIDIVYNVCDLILVFVVVSVLELCHYVDIVCALRCFLLALLSLEPS
ncbi:hypothetical protein C2G38_2217706 [Gigaspora rosea]|uniref:Uncharacterized protein n=1 Tax=Gigaspora rosea TaxID=44941 RepID=A0A397UAX0_9GLOM|nr:hypothetical protein C2G38_2217706 [Gigaspora rosea]